MSTQKKTENLETQTFISKTDENQQTGLDQQITENNSSSYRFGKNSSNKKRFTFNLVFCCITVSLCSFQFGFNLANLSSHAKFVKSYVFNETLPFRKYHEGLAKFTDGEIKIREADELLSDKKSELENTKARYLVCLFDPECRNEIELRSKEKEK